MSNPTEPAVPDGVIKAARMMAPKASRCEPVAFQWAIEAAYLVGALDQRRTDEATEHQALADRNAAQVRASRLHHALTVATQALEHEPDHCRFQGADFERAGMWQGQPRCDSCKQPYRVRKALDAILAVTHD